MESFGGHVARGQRGLGTLEFVLSPLHIGFSVVFVKDNPVAAVLAQPAVCFDLYDRFLNTGNRVKIQADSQISKDPTLS